MARYRAYEDHREEPELSSATVTRPAGPKNLAGFDAASLQRMIGNRATTEVLARRPSIAPALDSAKEREADAVADRAVARLGTNWPVPRPAPRSGGVPPALAGLVGPELGGVDRVRLDAGAQAADQAEGIGARAFAEGGRVAFARGELDLSSREGVHLAAHELTHATRHAPGRSVEGATLVHAKLAGTALAAEQMGGGRSTKGLRKTFNAKTNWDKVLDGLRAYERLEEALVAKGDPSPKVLGAARPKLLKALAKIEATIRSWQKANDGRGESSSSEERFQGFLGDQGSDNYEEDTRSKAKRRQTVAMLTPRIRTEMADVASGNWSRTLGLSDQKLRKRGKKDAGQMSEVQKLTYETEQGEFSGFFKEEQGYLPGTKTAGRDVESGIRLADPNFGARAMAMYRLDRLLGAGVTARVEFAVDQGRLGTVTEKARGTKAADMQWSTTEGDGKASADDAVLQRCMNKLQVLDAIALQLDRHGGNYFVQSDEAGKVTGVTGIDLDMAFGSEAHTPEEAPSGASAYAWRGLPEEIDEEFGKRILAVSADDVRGALAGLLPEPEVVATLDRFRFVQDKIRVAETEGLLRQDWGEASAGRTAPDKVGAFMEGKAQGTPTYTESLRSTQVEQSVTALAERVRKRLADQLPRDLPGPTLAAYEQAFLGDTTHRFFSSRGVVVRLVTEAVATRALSLAEAERAADALVRTVLSSEHQCCAALEVAVQEDRGTYAERTALADAAGRHWPAIMRRFASKKK